jgi:hypothetical protein
VTAAATASGQREIVWVDGDNELFVLAARVKVTLDEGIVLITIPVRCDEVGAASVEVPFAVGAERHPAGMLAATEDRPRGPDAIVDVWGEALIAFAWEVLLSMAFGVADVSGTDDDGAGLIPLALVSSRETLRVATIARHPFDRVKG